MRRHSPWLILGLLAAAAGAADVRVAVELDDLTRVVGRMPAQAVHVTAPALGELNIDLDRVSVIRMGPDGARFLLHNGDRIQGRPDWKDIRLATKLGELVIPLDVVRRLETLDANGIPSSLAEGLIAHLPGGRTNRNARLHATKPAAGPRGAPGTALEFDGGKSWVELSGGPDGKPMRQVTVTAWVKQAGPVEECGLIFVGGTRQRPGVVLATDSTEGLRWSPVLEGTDQDAETLQPTDLSEWTFVAGTYDGATSALYLDGRQAQTQRAPGVLSTRYGAFSIGGARPGLFAPAADNTDAEGGLTLPNGNTGVGFKGLIGEVRVYDRALNADEIRTLYEATK